MVVQTIAATRLSSPRDAAKPASGRNTSLGSGGNTFSSAIARPTPGAPSVSIRSTTQPTIPSSWGAVAVMIHTVDGWVVRPAWGARRRDPEVSPTPALRVAPVSRYQPPPPHPSGARPPAIPPELVPNHVALVMDGNGRWANARGLPRIEGHRHGEAALMDVARGAIEIGVRWLSAYAFSTENWKRSPDEVRFLMGFNRDVIRRRVDEMDAMGVRVRWAGRRPRLWRSVIRELEIAEEKTKNNDVLTLTMCVNYGGRAEIADAVKQIARLAAEGKIKPDKIDERTIARFLDEPDMPDVD